MDAHNQIVTEILNNWYKKDSQNRYFLLITKNGQSEDCPILIASGSPMRCTEDILVDLMLQDKHIYPVFKRAVEKIEEIVNTAKSLKDEQGED